MTVVQQYDSFDALGLAELVRKGEVHPSELVEEVIERIENVNPTLNAIVFKMYDRARAKAQRKIPEGSFSGVPFLMKDLIQCIKGVPTSSGSRFLKTWTPKYDTELYKRYKRAGLVTVAKTNTPEFGLLPITEPELFGPTRNPWNPDRTPGGSSGGAASAVAAGIVPMAHGGDGGGSIRIPSACCGLFGFKPTHGLNPPISDATGFWNGFVSEHVISRSVRDSAAALDATVGPEKHSACYTPAPNVPFLKETEKDPGKLKIAFHTDPITFGEVHPECKAALWNAVKICEELGHELIEVRPKYPIERLAFSFFVAVSCQMAGEISELEKEIGRKAENHEFERETRLLYLAGKLFSGAQYVEAERFLSEETHRIFNRYKEYDAILTPTIGCLPQKIGAARPSMIEGFVQELLTAKGFSHLLKSSKVIQLASARIEGYGAFTPLANITGQPGFSVPLHQSKRGIPVGVMFTGHLREDAKLFRLAAQLERARPWKDKRPPILASPSNNS